MMKSKKAQDSLIQSKIFWIVLVSITALILGYALKEIITKGLK